MKKNIEKLAAISKKKKRTIIGLMSGTSLDGLDIALCEIEGSGMDTKLFLKHFITKNYTTDFKLEVKKIFSKKTVDLQRLCLLNEWIAEQHAVMINECLNAWKIPNNKVDLIASHGQTIYHAPKHLHRNKKFGNGTLQIGDGDHLAVKTGIITISDFRQKNIAAGGEGAPLAAYGDYLLFKEDKANVILLNIGGIANLTFLPVKGKMFSTDIGPGNTLMDAWMQQNYPDKYYDENASIAKSGKVNKLLLQQLKNDPFFTLPYPKTTGPELFNLAYLDKARTESATLEITISDAMATLNKFTADTICSIINGLTNKNELTKIYVSGGGFHNPLLMQHLNKIIKHASLHSTIEKGIDPDAKEAILFAMLANECVAGTAATFNSIGEELPAVSMGKISLPD